MEYCYDYAFGELVFTEDGSFKCPVCGQLTPNQRSCAHGDEIVCVACECVFKKDEWRPFDDKLRHGARFVIYGPKFHICLVMYASSSQCNKESCQSSS